jgi:hypothetical protein
MKALFQNNFLEQSIFSYSICIQARRKSERQWLRHRGPPITAKKTKVLYEEGLRNIQYDFAPDPF